MLHHLNKLLRAKKGNKKEGRIFNQAGFSMLELLITLAILSILMITITNIIIVNLKVAKRVQARTYVREETTFATNLIKKDVRNALNVRANNTVVLDGQQRETIEIDMLDAQGNSGTIYWSVWENADGVPTLRRKVRVGGGVGDSFLTPGDIEIVQFDYEIIEDAVSDNTYVRIQLKSSNDGMPDGQTVNKAISVSTRNYDFE